MYRDLVPSQRIHGPPVPSDWVEKEKKTDEGSKPTISPMPFSRVCNFSAKKAKKFQNYFHHNGLLSQGLKMKVESIIMFNMEE